MASSSRPRIPLRVRLAAAARHLPILGVALLLPLASAHAAGPGWTANATVTKLVITGDGGVNVLLAPALSGCTSNAGYGPDFASIYPSHPGINRMKADLLAAYLTGGTVALYPVILPFLPPMPQPLSLMSWPKAATPCAIWPVQGRP